MVFHSAKTYLVQLRLCFQCCWFSVNLASSITSCENVSLDQYRTVIGPNAFPRMCRGMYLDVSVVGPTFIHSSHSPSAIFQICRTTEGPLHQYHLTTQWSLEATALWIRGTRHVSVISKELDNSSLFISTAATTSNAWMTLLPSVMQPLNTVLIPLNLDISMKNTFAAVCSISLFFDDYQNLSGCTGIMVSNSILTNSMGSPPDLLCFSHSLNDFSI